ncbi:type 1 glutamine amidotransferase domain-containing protein [Aestuariibacter sp. AA17]|uniref:Type 1 glutamine amidotransferase domain-containing protein n=1 Tax=Fluctibacter corallii TaxID=2984329 RepID=A0ABT3A483_9ALTE|nr:type 1 glutamine amidotransferase domain-containing protein [Aestuariibacter sp. AA17]MCV2883408.1 type 1 glutamine amidotransferase domain-containing protein [Aestuariibacter sp. AA17]
MKLKTTLSLAALLFSPLSMADDILIVMSDVSEMTLKGGQQYRTGFYLNELMEPVKLFIEAGHTLTFATPNGLAPTLDVNSDTPAHFQNDQAQYNAHKSLLNKLMLTDAEHSPVVSFSRIEQMGIDNFDAVFVPGGHAPMADLVANDQLGEFLAYFNGEAKPTGLVCHGPVALLSALPNSEQFEAEMKKGKKAKGDKNWIYAGYKMTVFSNSEEAQAQQYYLNGGELFYWPQNALINAGGKYKQSEQDWQANVVVDRELVTGQNPASAIGVAEEMLKMLK